MSANSVCEGSQRHVGTEAVTSTYLARPWNCATALCVRDREQPRDVPRDGAASKAASLLLWLRFIGLLFVLGSQAQVHAATYYIDYVAGSDSNSGVAKASAWKRHPYMKGWAGGAKYAHSAGDRFIFKGGSVWQADALPLTPASGGTATTPDYYGVDTSWFNGGTFTQPIFDAQATTLSGLFVIESASNITVDNLEMRNVVFPDNQGTGLITIGYTPKNILIKNAYLHKWTLASGIGSDDAHGGVIVNTGNVPPAGIVVDSTTISNAEYSATKNNGVAVRNVQTVSGSTISDVPTAILFAGIVHSNHIYNINYPKADFDGAYHTNLIYMAAQSLNPPQELVYNNRIHDIGSGTGIYIEPCFYSSFGPATVNVYNNVVYNAKMGGGGIILVDPESGSGSCGNVSIYGNTLQQPDGSQIGMIRVLANHSGSNRIASVVARNNLYIGPNGEWDLSLAASASSQNNLQLSNATATAAGYNAANAYKPTTASAPSVNKGTAITCSACVGIANDIFGVARGQNGAWDVGAYEFSSTVLTAPTNLRVQ